MHRELTILLQSSLCLDFLMGSENWAVHFANIFSPIAGEYDLIGTHPEAADTLRNVTEYQSVTAELRTALAPELELIESRISQPAKELQALMKQIRKNMTKRDHKVRFGHTCETLGRNYMGP